MVLHAGRDLTLAHDQVKRWSKAKLRAYSDSVPCLGEISSKTERKMVKSSGRISDVLCNGKSTGMQLNSSENILAGFTTLWILQQIQNDLESEFFEPEQFPDKIIFMSMLNDTDWTKRNIEET